MANNKKRKNYGSNNSSGTARPITVKEKKKQLIKERIHSDPVKSRGMRALGIIVSAILLSRIALFIYELAYYAYLGLSVGVISNLLLLPLLLILFMAHDGNRGLLAVSAVSAVVRIIYLFSSTYPALEGLSGSGVFVAAYAVIMAAQFIMSVTALSMPSTDAYSKEMQKINYELRSSLMNGTRR
ncbi:MAG: hypothetical protein IKB38_04000 [Clostridia bacterium]|nr:hypothetical protein [Clostridia bacterium]